MTLMEFVGCASLAYGPALSLFLFTIMKDPVRIIILILSAFFWLLSLLASSLLWHLLPAAPALPIGVLASVLLQELFRYLLYKVLRKAETGLKKVHVPNTNMEITTNKHVLSYVAGLGFGTMSAAFSLANILAEVAGPGTVGFGGGVEYFSLISAAFSLCFLLLHTLWSIIFFTGIDSEEKLLVGWVVISHVVVSCLTLLNQWQIYLATLLPAYLVLALTAAIAFRTTKTHAELSPQSNILSAH